jgi:hypothetical protein
MKFKHHGRNAEEGFDCYGYVIHKYKEYHNISIPEVDYRKSIAREAYDNATALINSGAWTISKTPKEGSIMVTDFGNAYEISFMVADDTAETFGKKGVSRLTFTNIPTNCVGFFTLK